MRTQLPSKVGAVQPELPGYLRHVQLNIVHAVARFDGFLVLEAGGRLLSAECVQLDAGSLLAVARHAVACQQQVAVVFADVGLQSRHGHSTRAANLDAGH